MVTLALCICANLPQTGTSYQITWATYVSVQSIRAREKLWHLALTLQVCNSIDLDYSVVKKHDEYVFAVLPTAVYVMHASQVCLTRFWVSQH